MQTRISVSLTHQLTPRLLPPLFLFHFPSLSRRNFNFLSFSHTKCICTPKPLTFCSSTSSESISYGGWDDLEFGGDSIQSGEFNQLRNFLSSLGINDKRYIFVYLLGFVCALAISRVKVSSIIVVPACVLVFAFGFSFGFVNGGHMNEFSLIAIKNKTKDESFRAPIENLRYMVDVLNDFDIKFANLKNDIRSGINSNLITVSDLEGYIKAIESIALSALNTKNVAEGVIDNISVENQEIERTSNQKVSKRKKEINGTGFDFSQFVLGLFKGNLKTNKTKDLVKRELTDVAANDQTQRNILAPVEKHIPNYVNTPIGTEVSGNSFSSVDTFGGPDITQIGAEELVERTRRMNAIGENEEMNFLRFDSGAKCFKGKEYSFENNEVRIMDNDLHSLNKSSFNSVESFKYTNDLHDMDVGVHHKHMRNDAYFDQERAFKKFNRNHKPIDNTEHQTLNKENNPSHSVDFDSSPSSMVSDDMVFNGYLTEANTLLKKARYYLKDEGDKGDIEKTLYKSAKLLSKAIDMKPMSLLAVGQLGNTYLLHGELKLKTSRKLRSLLARENESLYFEISDFIDGLGEELGSKEKVGSVLVDVCEECEELLVKAGRKYRMALSIDGNDIRALYNWGLALSFRAQLIADIGPEAAFDADKVFLAAIDKFDAMMSKGNVYAPDALFRWGLALQQRSRLRRRNSRERVKLLKQAKSMYEDALDMDTHNLQVREALLSCISELNYMNY